MSDQPSSDQQAGLDFTAESAETQLLWEQLQKLPNPEPSPHLRQQFYRALEKAGRPSLLQQIRNWLGLSGGAGFITASACLMAGLLAGSFLTQHNFAKPSDFLALQQQVNLLQRNLVLDRLESDSSSKRLRGIFDAASLVEGDPEIARALLTRAMEDKVYTIRSAAIDALGPQLGSPAVGDELMTLLGNSQSPLVQLALVELILRYGNQMQIDYLIQISENGGLSEELSKYVQSSLSSNEA